MLDLEQTIRQHVPLGRANSKGWVQVLCRVCNDHGKKGLRGGFNFSGGGLGYQCFNCHHTAHYVSGQYSSPSDDLKTVFTSFGIPDDIWNQLVMESLKNRNSDLAIANFDKKVLKQNTFEPKPIPLPEFFFPLADLPEDLPIRQLAELHLTEERQIEPSAYPFMIGFKDKAFKHSDEWAKRLIIPVYDRTGRLIFYQGRDLLGKSNAKYKSSATERDNVLYGMDQVYAHSNTPLFITEGFFDAFHLNGCAVLGRQMTEGMIHHLNRSIREKVVVPDRFGSGQDLALAALKQGWKVSTPDLGGCKDVTDAVIKYGKLYVMKTILDNIHSGFAAEMHIRVYCKK